MLLSPGSTQRWTGQEGACSELSQRPSVCAVVCHAICPTVCPAFVQCSLQSKVVNTGKKTLWKKAQNSVFIFIFIFQVIRIRWHKPHTLPDPTSPLPQGRQTQSRTPEWTQVWTKASVSVNHREPRWEVKKLNKTEGVSPPVHLSPPPACARPAQSAEGSPSPGCSRWTTRCPCFRPTAAGSPSDQLVKSARRSQSPSRPGH